MTKVDIEKTISQYQQVTTTAKETVLSKNDEYGQSWIIFRPFSMLDQIFIKLQRIRTIQEKGVQEIKEEPIEEDFYHIINYCTFGLILINIKPQTDFSKEELSTQYDTTTNAVLDLCKSKNHDYGEAWRLLNVSSMVDLSLAKCLRGKMMQNNKALTEPKLSEILKDIMNYAIFCRIRITEGTDPMI